MSLLNIAILGATGQVGEAIINQLEEREFPISTLFAIASENSTSEQVRFHNKNINVISPDDFDWSQVDIAFFAAGTLASQYYAEKATSSGCVVIDLSGAFSLDTEIPLIVPGINDFVLADFRSRSIISVANGTVCQLLKTVSSLIDYQEINNLNVSSFLPASYYGKAGVSELASQSVRLLNGLEVEKEGIFSSRLAFNLLPIQNEDNKNEIQVIEQTRRILDNPDLPMSCEFISVPVFHCITQTISFSTRDIVDIELAKYKTQNNKEIKLISDEEPLTPASLLSAADNIYVGRLKPSYGMPETIQCWSVADNIRYLGAIMAIQVAETIVKEYW